MKKRSDKGDIEIDKIIILILAVFVLVILIIIAFVSKDKLASLGEKVYNIFRFFGAR